MTDWQEQMAGIGNEEMTRGQTNNEDLLHSSPNTAILRTSDRILFKRCRRRWGLSSHLRQNLGTRETATPLWVGSGFHFALEDFHGNRKYGRDAKIGQYRASKAWDEYVRATYKFSKDSLPADWQDQLPLVRAMLDYYQDHWLKYRDPLKTLMVDGIPQVEVGFKIELPWDGRYGYERVIYSGTIDRVAVDEFGGLWGLEYKTAKSIANLHYQVDPQVSAYMWALRNLYPDRTINGILYQQHLKDYPEGPRLLLNGTLSVAENQRTSLALYRDSLKKMYGDVNKAPPKNIGFLNTLAKREDCDPLRGRDAFVQRDPIYRNQFSADTESIKILMEAEEMLNPDLALYPNATRDCAYMCPFLGVCVSMDDGGDWEYELEHDYVPRAPVYDSWRSYLPEVN